MGINSKNNNDVSHISCCLAVDAGIVIFGRLFWSNILRRHLSNGEDLKSVSWELEQLRWFQVVGIEERSGTTAEWNSQGQKNLNVSFQPFWLDKELKINLISLHIRLSHVNIWQ